MWKKKIGTWGGVHLESKKKKRKVGILISSITLGLVLLLGLSYAWFTLTLTGEKQNVIKVGNLSLLLDDSMGEGIHLENAIPMSFDVGLQQEPYHFEVTNDGSVDAEYQIYLDITGNDVYSYYALRESGKVIRIIDSGAVSSASASNHSVLLTQGVLSAKQKRNYDLSIWINGDNVGEEYMMTDFTANIRLEASQTKKQKLVTALKNNCSGVTNCDRTVDNITYMQEGYYNGHVQYIWYSGKLWFVTNYDDEGNVKMMTEDPVTFLSYGTNHNFQGSHVETWLNEEFLPSLNNYESFLVTDYPWDYSLASNYFYDPSPKNNIVTSPVGLMNIWEMYEGTNKDNRLTMSDMILEHGGDYYLGTSRSDGVVFLGGIAFTRLTGVEANDARFFGVSPMVVLKKGATIISGDGTIDNPYRLKGDESASNGDNLIDRHSGEYVAFGEGMNSLYRISKSLGYMTKVVAAHQLLTAEVTETGEEIHFLNYESRGDIKYPYTTTTDYNKYLKDSREYPLAYFLNHDFLNPFYGYLTESEVAMIAPNQTWYPGTIVGGESFQKNQTSANAVSATVGLPSLGEMYNVVQKPDYSRKDLMVMESGTLSSSLILNGTGSSVYSGINGGPEYFRPSFYLKSDVYIKAGSGTRLDPYILGQW